MKYLVLHFSIAFVALCATTLASPVLAVQDTFSGGAPAADPRSVVGEDGTGNVWQTHTDAYGENSNFAMSDFYSSPQPFNPDDISSGSGTFATSFQLTLDSSESGSGVAGITQDAIRSGLTNHLIVIGDFSDTSTWTIWDITYGMLDADSGLFQQITFTAPLGTQLSQGVDFSLNVNFAGIMTSDFGWTASFDDSTSISFGSFNALSISAVPVPQSLGLLSLGLFGLGAVMRRKGGAGS